jgi:hypothetical protein
LRYTFRRAVSVERDGYHERMRNSTESTNTAVMAHTSREVAVLLMFVVEGVQLGPPERARPAELGVGRLRDARGHRARDRGDSPRALSRRRARRWGARAPVRAAALHPGTED